MQAAFSKSDDLAGRFASGLDYRFWGKVCYHKTLPRFSEIRPVEVSPCLDALLQRPDQSSVPHP